MTGQISADAPSILGTDDVRLVGQVGFSLTWRIQTRLGETSCLCVCREQISHGNQSFLFKHIVFPFHLLNKPAYPRGISSETLSPGIWDVMGHRSHGV